MLPKQLAIRRDGEKKPTHTKKKKKIQNEGQKKVHKAVVTFKKVRIDAENLFF